MNEITINCYTENDMNHNMFQLKGYGYNKTHDCMWVKIYEKDGCRPVVLKREY